MLTFLLALFPIAQHAEIERMHGIFSGNFTAGAAFVELPTGPAVIAGSNFWAEVYIPDNDQYWSVLSRAAGSAEGYRVDYVSPRVQLAGLAAGDVLGGPEDELVLVRKDGVVEILDPATRALLATFQGPALPLGLAVAQADADAHAEILISTAGACASFDGAGVQDWQTALLTGAMAVAGQMDADPGFEIAALNRAVLDVATMTVQWTIPFPPADLDVGDFDRNGIQELVILNPGSAGSPVTIYDAGSGLLLQRLVDPAPGDHLYPQCVRAADLNHDGIPEIACGFRRRELPLATDLAVWDAITGQALVNFRTSVAGPFEILAGNSDSDPLAELVVFGAGAQVLDVDSLGAEVEWQSPGLRAIHAGPAFADLEGDGAPEVIVAGDGFDTLYPYLAVHDGEDLSVRLVSRRVFGVYSGAVILDLEAEDLDGDGRDEIIFAGRDRTGNNLGFARVFALHRYTRELEQTWTAGTGNYDPRELSCVEAVDLDRDGSFEICTGENRSERRGAVVQVFQYPSSQLLREFSPIGPASGASIADLASADLDGDGFPELLALVKDEGLFVFDQFSNAPKAVVRHPFISLRLREVQGKPMLLLSDRPGKMHAYRLAAPGSFVRVGETGALLSPVSALLPGPGGLGWARSRGRLSLLNLTGSRVAWQSEDYGGDEDSAGFTILVDPAHPERCLMTSPSGLLGFRAR